MYSGKGIATPAHAPDSCVANQSASPHVFHEGRNRFLKSVARAGRLGDRPRPAPRLLGASATRSREDKAVELRTRRRPVTRVARFAFGPALNQR